MRRLYPLRSQLSRQFLFMLTGILLAVFASMYAYSVPLIKQQVFEIERNSSRLTLNNVFEIANRMYANLEDYRTQALHSHQQQLKVAVAMAESYLRSAYREGYTQGLSETQIRQRAFSALRDFTYGNHDYIWITGYDGMMLSHPDPRFHGKDSAQMLDSDGRAIVPNIVHKVRKAGEGFYQYSWQRLSGDKPLPKVSYVKNYPEWGFVIGSGVYMDDVETEFQLRKERSLAELRVALQNIKIAKTGYLYVFDSEARMLFHPNNNIDRTEFKNLQNPVTKQSIFKDLIAVADTGKELYYQWDKPDDPGNYIYEKLAFVRYLKGFDWYIGSSVYLEELRSSAAILSTRLMALAALTILAALGLAYYFITQMTRPLEQLANTALRVSQGDLSAKSGIQQDGEIGILAKSFDGMVEQLKTNIDSLDTQVKQRTDALLETNAKAQRMKAVGQLAGGLAHDFNNLLSIILGNLLLLNERLQDKELAAYVNPAIRATRRGADITQRLLAFSRRQPLQPETVDVGQLTAETVELLRGSLPSHINLSYLPDNTTPLLATIDPSHLENALINLALNARDAMPQGGQLSFAVTALQLTEGLMLDESVPSGHYIQIQVMDTGTGFSEDSQRLAFEPFYSTKVGTTNSGLGLSMVYGFVKQSHGYIRIDSQAQQGATITLLLPAALDYPALAERGKDDAVSLTNLQGQLFLLVEDNADVRAVVRQQLISLGVQVVEAEDAEEGLGLAQALPSLVGLVSDIMLTGKMDGYQLAQHFAALKPLSIIVLMSGYAYPAALHKKNLSFIQLHKPFDLQQLKQALWQASQTKEAGLCKS